MNLKTNKSVKIIKIDFSKMNWRGISFYINSI